MGCVCTIWCRSLAACLSLARRESCAYSRHSRPPVLLVADTLCSGLALDVQLGELYWTSASGHTLWKLGYRSYNDSYFEAHPNEPVYSISNPDDANVAQVVVSGHGRFWQGS